MSLFCILSEWPFPSYTEQRAVMYFHIPQHSSRTVTEAWEQLQNLAREREWNCIAHAYCFSVRSSMLPVMQGELRPCHWKLHTANSVWNSAIEQFTSSSACISDVSDWNLSCDNYPGYLLWSFPVTPDKYQDGTSKIRPRPLPHPFHSLLSIVLSMLRRVAASAAM